jgi:hypothetical protein
MDVNASGEGSKGLEKDRRELMLASLIAWQRSQMSQKSSRVNPGRTHTGKAQGKRYHSVPMYVNVRGVGTYQTDKPHQAHHSRKEYTRH